MKKFLPFLVFGFLILTNSNLFAQSPACGQICDFYTTCLEQQAKKKLAGDEAAKVKAGCMNTCRKNFPSVSACYEQHANQCTEFNSCLVSSYKSKDKK
ncbi:Cys-rich protein [Leptospira perolatii]|uniref:Cys-rich protein n=1 Tax=Leptospira perolatii TaxID=2023191 RepID=A0A2M9ZL72_9LEPT|nr:Cys-rich protein [Leptospira perolatii]PJZ70341.1 Cys-rich protein [Leptospira perolatii]PJZ72775.1 Cys-rich protein [Leptospira perolatii]